MKRRTRITGLAACVGLAALSGTNARAVETKSGDANHAVANATPGLQKDSSQIALSGVKVGCPFNDMGTATLDNAAYYWCLASGLGSYRTGYSAADARMTILALDNSEPDGICYDERDPDIKWIEIKAPAGGLAKIHKFWGPDVNGGGQVRVKINDDAEVGIVTQHHVNPTAALAAALAAAGYAVEQGTSYLAIAADLGGNMVTRLSITDTDARALRTMIAVEPASHDHDSSYCDPYP
jgi:hypothetical protein